MLRSPLAVCNRLAIFITFSIQYYATMRMFMAFYLLTAYYVLPYALGSLAVFGGKGLAIEKQPYTLGMLAKLACDLGNPTDDAFAEFIWRLSNSNGIPCDVAADFMRAAGYEPFRGFPLTRLAQ